MSNDYKYGVEYACNGVKPDLPDDVLVCQFWRERWLSTVKRCIDWISWDQVTAFRIVDDRYKPENWYERGELPPVGVKFEAYFPKDSTPSWDIGVVVYMSEEHAILKFDDGEEIYYPHHELVKIAKFRPLRTEREKFIDAADAVIHEHMAGGGVKAEYLGALFDAGFRAPEKE